MENASNALLMAAGILISIMIISLGTYLFMTFGNYSKQINGTISQTKIDEYNSQFTKYEGTACTPHDVVTLINLAKDTNKKYGYEEGQDAYINVKAIGKENTVTETSNIQDLNTFIEANIDTNGNVTTFTCNVKIDQNLGLVTSVTFI